MSFFIFEDQKAVEVNNYLVEVFKPKKIDFGTNFLDFNNSKFQIVANLYVTISKMKNDYFLIALGDNNEVGFTNIQNIEKYTTIQDILDNEYSIQSISNGNALGIFNSIFYIYLELMKKYKLTNIRFRGATSKLQELYLKLLENKKLNSFLKDIGLEMKKDKNNYIIINTLPSWKR